MNLRVVINQIRIPKYLSPISQFHSSNKTLTSDSKLGFISREDEELHSRKPVSRGDVGGRRIEDDEEEEAESLNRKGVSALSSVRSQVQVSHPWPEWVELMEHLSKKGYFGNGGYPFDRDEMGTKDSNRIRTACLNFARDHFAIMRYFSRKDIQVVAGCGCPSLDRKVVNSGKRLRAHVGIEEGNVCSACLLRGSCERAYVNARKDEIGRTVDVMRMLLTYGLDQVTGAVENKGCLNKRVKESIRRLLNEILDLSIKEIHSEPPKVSPIRRLSTMPENSILPQSGHSSILMKQGDWICPKCNFLNFARNIKCLRCDGLFEERLRKLGEDQDHLPLKKGDWLCDKCNFLNFAKNSRCLQCKEKPSKRQINPGEWECESCNYINFRRNMVCLKCGWKRPKAANHSGSPTQLQHEDWAFSQPQRLKFVRDADETTAQPSGIHERVWAEQGNDFWRYLKGNKNEDDDGLGVGNKFLDFPDFPIEGGKSGQSQSPQDKERWKEEMSKMSRSTSWERGNGDELSSGRLSRRIEFLASDDEEMAGWFGGQRIGAEN